MDELYRDIILDHYKNPRNFGELADAEVTGEKDNPLCGDKIILNIKYKKLNINNKPQTIISDIKFSGQGCAISMASASLLTEYVKGKDVSILKKMTADDMVKLLQIEVSATRLKCALLPLEVLQEVI
jgi:nitrogen fixation NifU-like protein